VLKKILSLSSLCAGLLLVTSSCGKTSDFNHGKIAWDADNTPERIGLDRKEFELDFNKLDKQGFLTEKPWSDHYWPDYQGGISYRWNSFSTNEHDKIFYKTKNSSQLTKKEIQYLSPAEKYDLLLGDESYSTTRNERSRTGVLTNSNIPFWFGICHGWAAATLFYKTPNPVTVRRSDGLDIPFGSSDIKALLSHFLIDPSINSRTYWVSRRCYVEEEELRRQMQTGKVSPAEYRRQMESADCIGVNPGSMHILFANMIARKNEGLIMDRTRDAQVWNQPIYGYKSHTVDKRRHGFSPGADKRTVTEVRVTTKTYYIAEVSPSWQKDSGVDPSVVAYYEYWLELDKNNEIIGGTWISEERPDFLWRMVKPEFSSRYKALGELYQLSTQPQSGHVRLATLK
jgi:hypothetical protein